MQVDHLPRTSGIYKITCTANGRIYIGSSVNLYKRGCDHRRDMVQNKHHSRHIQHSCNKYGIEGFYIDILEFCDVPMLISREQYYIDTLKPQFNCCPTAGSALGRRLSSDTKLKLSLIQKGKRHSDETRIKMSLARLGKPPHNKGKPLSIETRLKISQGKKGKPAGKRNKPISEETKAKISASKTGKKHSEETKLKMSRAKKGISRVVMKHSEETKLKMSVSAKRRWERKRLEKEMMEI